MYFSFFKLKKWGKKTAETRRRNCAVLPYYALAVEGAPEFGSGFRRADGGDGTAQLFGHFPGDGKAQSEA